MKNVNHILTEKGITDVWSTDANSTVYEALVILAEKNVSALLVYEDQQIVGIFSEKDYARKVILKGRSSRETLIREIMTTEVITVQPDQTMDECMAIMSAEHIHHLPVCIEDRLLGIISIGDVVKTIIVGHEYKIEQLTKYITGVT